MVKRQSSTVIGQIHLQRPTKRPTTIMPACNERRIQEAVLGVFRKFEYTAIDLDALVYYVLQEFDFHPSGYEMMNTRIREHIIDNFAIEQGSYRRVSEVCLRRITVCYTIDKAEE